MVHFKHWRELEEEEVEFKLRAVELDEADLLLELELRLREEQACAKNSSSLQ
jgi:hypothetical protein